MMKFREISIYFNFWSLDYLYMNANSAWIANIEKYYLWLGRSPPGIRPTILVTKKKKMVITCENIGFITRGLWPLVINPIFSLVITITTRDIFQYFFPAIYYYLNIVWHLQWSYFSVQLPMFKSKYLFSS